MKLKAVLGRDFYLFARELISATVLTVILAALGVFISWSAMKSEKASYTPAQVALVDDEGGFFSRFVINLISKQDYVSSIFNISVVSDEEAINGINSGRWVAVIRLPKGYYSDISNGKPVSATIILCRDEPVYYQLFELLSILGERFISAGQFGFLSGQEALVESGELLLMNDYIKKSNSVFASEVFGSKSKYCITTDIGYEGSSLSLISYYCLIYTALIFELCSIFFTNLMSCDSSRPVLARYKSFGINNFTFMIGKVAYPFLFRMALYVIVIWVASIFFDITVTATALLSAVAGLLFISFIGAVILVSFSGQETGILIITASSLVGLLLKGGIIPQFMLPKIIIIIGNYSPLGIIFTCLSSAFGCEIDIMQLGIMFLFSAVCVIIVHMRIKSVLVGRANKE